MEKVCETTYIDLHYLTGSARKRERSGNSGGRWRSKHKFFKRKKNTHNFSIGKSCEMTSTDLHYPAGSPGNAPDPETAEVVEVKT